MPFIMGAFCSVGRFASAAIFALVAVAAAASDANATKPHIVFVMADDFGWANLGVHAKGQPNEDEAQTPRLDSLISNGVLLDRHYVFRFCSPSRCAFTSGRNPIHVNLFNDALGEYNPADPVSGFSGIPRNYTGVAEKLASAGYSTVAAGKVCAEYAHRFGRSGLTSNCVRSGMRGLQPRTTPRTGAATTAASCTSPRVSARGRAPARASQSSLVCAPPLSERLLVKHRQRRQGQRDLTRLLHEQRVVHGPLEGHRPCLWDEQLVGLLDQPRGGLRLRGRALQLVRRQRDPGARPLAAPLPILRPARGEARSSCQAGPAPVSAAPLAPAPRCTRRSRSPPPSSQTSRSSTARTARTTPRSQTRSTRSSAMSSTRSSRAACGRTRSSFFRPTTAGRSTSTRTRTRCSTGRRTTGRCGAARCVLVPALWTA